MRELGMDAIRARISVRSYDKTPLGAEEKKHLSRAFVDAVPGPFGSRPRFALISSEDDGALRKIGTYGQIRGTGDFIVGVIAKRRFACVDFGYCLEGIVLAATKLGLGTCWVGGVFDRGAVIKALGAADDEFAPAMTPIGRPADQLSFQDRLIRFSAASHKRKAPERLFFKAGKSGALETILDPGLWALVFEAVRIAPSASNRQPWRLVLEPHDGREILHLFMDEDRLYNNMLGAVKLQELDMGIAMRHVELAAAESGIEASWSRLETRPGPFGKLRYIASFL